LGLLVSVSIECLQLVELVIDVGFGRTVDIDDVICNVIGTVIGYLIYNGLTAMEKIDNKSPHRGKQISIRIMKRS
jgi:glycopeptide antibiotics resistance protein